MYVYLHLASTVVVLHIIAYFITIKLKAHNYTSMYDIVLDMSERVRLYELYVYPCFSYINMKHEHKNWNFEFQHE